MPDPDELKAAAAKYLNPIDEDIFAQLAAASATRVAEPVYSEAELVHHPSAPRTTVVPLLPPLDPSVVGDQWGASPSGAHGSTTRAEVGMEGGEHRGSGHVRVVFLAGATARRRG
jgi:hypothetical protein